jgi:hypothetical protein
MRKRLIKPPPPLFLVGEIEILYFLLPEGSEL